MAIWKLSLFMAGMLGLSACGPQTSELPSDSVIKGVGWVGATVSDLDRTAVLYSTALDLKQVDDSTIMQNPAFDKLAGRTDVVAQTRMMRSVNTQIRFMTFAETSSEAKDTPEMDVQGPGIMHVCYQVNQETQAYQKFLAGGARFLGEQEMQQLNPKNPVFYSYSRDFDGLIAEIEHVDVSKLDLPKPPKNQYRVRQVALSTPDIDRLAEFYSKFLEQPEFRRFGQWPFLRMEGEKSDKVTGLEGTSAEAAWFQIRNLELEIFQFHSHPTGDLENPRPIDANGYSMIVFDVTDMDAARELLIYAGGSVETEPVPMDGGQIMFGRDPDGNLIGLQTAPIDSLVSSRNFKNNGIE